MKKIITAITIGLCTLLFFLSACKKDNANTYTVSGRLVDRCTGGQPLAWVDIELTGYAYTCTGSVNVKGKTGANGEFALSYPTGCSENDFIDLHFKGIGEDMYVANIRANRDVNLGDIVMRNNLSYKRVLKTDTAYSSADTLFYDIKPKASNPSDSVYKILVGPFSDRIIDTVMVTIGYNMLKYNSLYPVAYEYAVLKSGRKIYKTLSLQVYLKPPCSPDEKVLDISR